MEDISDPFDFYYSENWFFVKEVYVPRKIVLDIIAVNKSLFSPFTVIGIITENGEAVFWAQVKKRRGSSLIKFRIKWSLSIIADFKKLNMKE